MAKRVTFPATGGAAEGELVEPAGAGKAPGVVLVQEWWGVSDHIRSLLDRLAKEGFVALAPDLYHGKITKNADEAASMMQSLDRPKALGEIAGAAKYLHEHPRTGGKVAVMGFCMGGGFSFAAAASVPNLGAVVPFYGLSPLDTTDWSKVTAPILAHFASRDQWATVDAAKQIQSKLQSLGKSMTLEVYDADHAFVNDTRPEVHNAGEAKKAWERTVKFLHANLG